jgi:glycosyltransferase involved in cell wall biosynthesis
VKATLCMWTRNGSKTLKPVLNRINQVIPKDVVAEKFIVDDHSIDDTKNIATECGWDIYLNHGRGISDGANTALNFVGTEYFCSFEQDLLLSKYWWHRISRLVQQKNVAAASGIRFLPKRNFCYNLEKYSLITQQNSDYGRTLDNTIWNTKILKDLGGFPKHKYCCVDSSLSELIKYHGLKWIVDYDVISEHLHNELLIGELKRYGFYGQSLAEQKMICNKDTDRSGVSYEIGAIHFFVKLLKSPFSSGILVAKMRDPRLFVSNPSIRLFYLLGYLRGNMK